MNTVAIATLLKQQGHKAIDTNNFADAQSLLEASAALLGREASPAIADLASTLVDLGYACQSNEDWTSAEESYAQCEALLATGLVNPTSAFELKLQLFVNHGDLMLRQKKYQDARNLSEAGLEFAAKNEISRSQWVPYLFANLGEAELELAQYTAAKVAYEQAIDVCEPRNTIIDIAREKLAQIEQRRTEADIQLAAGLRQDLDRIVERFELGLAELDESVVHARLNAVRDEVINIIACCDSDLVDKPNAWKVFAQLLALQGDISIKVAELEVANQPKLTFNSCKYKWAMHLTKDARLLYRTAVEIYGMAGAERDLITALEEKLDLLNKSEQGVAEAALRRFESTSSSAWVKHS